ncbi:MAG TPA: phage virion morphogenesis protein [Phycisphaerae bacterium]|nr:phage virion morphogenesis protein [Phycisphaerae bacterium]
MIIEVEDAEFQARFENIWRQLQPGSQSRGLMRAVGYYMRRRTLKHFEEESDPEGRDWEPLQQSTIMSRMRAGSRARYRRAGRSMGRALAAKERAEHALSRARKDSTRAKAQGRIDRANQRITKAGATQARAAGKILSGQTGDLRRRITSIADATSAEIGTNVFYGIFHQEGAPRAHIPVRAFLGIADEDAGGIEKLAWDYLVRVTG